jgi:hypothetical protein
MKMRGVHPSYLGKVDICVVGSDPGVNSTVTPFCKTDGLYFDDKSEPETFKYEFEKDIFEYRKENETGVFVDYDDTIDYTNIKEFSNKLKEKFSITEIENENTKYHYVKYILPDPETEEF